MERNNFCKRCRHIVSPKDTVCPYCGNRLSEKPENKPQHKHKHTNLLYIIVLAPFILVMSGVCGFYLLSGEDTEWISEQNQTSLSTENTQNTSNINNTDNTDNTAAPQNSSNTDDTAAQPAAADTAGADIPDNSENQNNTDTSPAEEITPAPAPTPPPYTPTPEPTPVIALSSPDKYGHTGKLPPKFTSYKASSAAEDVYSAAHAFDGSMDNVWGAGIETGGIGEWITMSAADYQGVSGIKIYNGNTRSEEDFNANARISIVELSFSDGSYIRKILQDGFSRNEPQIIRFDNIINTKFIKIKILDKYGDSDIVCVGEIEVF